MAYHNGSVRPFFADAITTTATIPLPNHVTGDLIIVPVSQDACIERHIKIDHHRRGSDS